MWYSKGVFLFQLMYDKDEHDQNATYLYDCFFERVSDGYGMTRQRLQSIYNTRSWIFPLFVYIQNLLSAASFNQFILSFSIKFNEHDNITDIAVIIFSLVNDSSRIFTLSILDCIAMKEDKSDTTPMFATSIHQFAIYSTLQFTICSLIEKYGTFQQLDFPINNQFFVNHTLSTYILGLLQFYCSDLPDNARTTGVVVKKEDKPWIFSFHMDDMDTPQTRIFFLLSQALIDDIFSPCFGSQTFHEIAEIPIQNMSKSFLYSVIETSFSHDNRVDSILSSIYFGKNVLSRRRPTLNMDPFCHSFVYASLSIQPVSENITYFYVYPDYQRQHLGIHLMQSLAKVMILLRCTVDFSSEENFERTFQNVLDQLQNLNCFVKKPKLFASHISRYLQNLYTRFGFVASHDQPDKDFVRMQFDTQKFRELPLFEKKEWFQRIISTSITFPIKTPKNVISPYDYVCPLLLWVLYIFIVWIVMTVLILKRIFHHHHTLKYSTVILDLVYGIVWILQTWIVVCYIRFFWQLSSLVFHYHEAHAADKINPFIDFRHELALLQRRYIPFPFFFSILQLVNLIIIISSIPYRNRNT